MTEARKMIDASTLPIITPCSKVVGVIVGVNKFVAVGVGVTANDTSMTVN